MCGRGCLKGVSILFNTLIALIGTAVIFTTFFLRFDDRGQGYIQHFMDRYGSYIINIDTIFYTLLSTIVVGIFTALVGLIGVFGACFESFRTLVTFAFLLALNMFAKIVVGMLTYAYIDEIKGMVQRGLMSQIDMFSNSTSKEVQQIIELLDDMQNTLKCCGCNNISDYSYESGLINGTIAPNLPKGCKENEYQDTGCCEQLWREILCSMSVIGYGCLGFLIVEALALIFALVLARKVPSPKSELRYRQGKKLRRVLKVSKKKWIFGHTPPQQFDSYKGRLPEYLGPEQSTYL